MHRRHVALAAIVLSSTAGFAETAWAERQAPRCSDEMSALLLKHARKHGVPIDLLHRIVIRESRYNAAARHSRYYGLMQITYATAKSMGYHGAPNGLLDAETNLTYAVPYLANAYMLSHGNDDRAVRLYAAGYYATAKQQHMIADLRTADSPAVVPVQIAVVREAPRNPVAQLFSLLTSQPPAPEPTSVATAADAPAPATADAASDRKAEKTVPAEKAVARAASGKPAAHVAEPKLPPAKAAAAEKVQVATTGPSAKTDEHLNGAPEPVPAGFTKAAATETAAPASIAAQPAKLQVATAGAKARRKTAKLAKKTRPSAEPATDVADAVAPEAAAASEPVETASAAKASGPKKKSIRAAKQVAAAAPADDAAPEAGTTQVARHVHSKPRHAHVQQAAASKAEVTADP